MLEIRRSRRSDTRKERKIDARSAKLSVTNSLVDGLQRLVDRASKSTLSGDSLVRIKQFIEAAEKDSKSPGKDKSKQRSNVNCENFSGGSGSCCANAVGRLAADKDEAGRLEVGGKSRKILC